MSPSKRIGLYCELLDVIWIQGNSAFSIAFSIFLKNPLDIRT